ncbi:hypothetical protein [Streptomyces dubilierae]|uniref:Uncharacterized protein n=1 Tax=Streptomyces dubilierae TaxID=3075533 RepID=A0ABU2P211_9ACTN|nr:hypothetical protein [Streptomyces sp. DSM 41921]MDT0386186.1 hypothetical protein [Streptomyces sp. DSM 41921]
MSDEKPNVLHTANQVARSWAGDVFAKDLNGIDRSLLTPGGCRISRSARAGALDGEGADVSHRHAASRPVPALFRTLRASFHGDLEPAAALALLDRLEFPANSRHFAELRHVLTAGHKNPYLSLGA